MGQTHAVESSRTYDRQKRGDPDPCNRKVVYVIGADGAQRFSYNRGPDSYFAETAMLDPQSLRAVAPANFRIAVFRGELTVALGSLYVGRDGTSRLKGLHHVSSLLAADEYVGIPSAAFRDRDRIEITLPDHFI
jgi:hypothetical protein